MAQRMGTYDLLLPFSVQDAPTEASVGDLGSSRICRAMDTVQDPSWRTQQPRRITAGIAALLSAAFLATAFLVAAHVSPRGDTAEPLASVGLASDKLTGDPDCHTAARGDACHTDVLYAMKDRAEHPEWYEGLSNDSTFADFQAFMHGQVLNSGERRCPKPCIKDLPFSKKAHKAHKKNSTGSKKAKKDCHDAVAGEECYNHVIYTKQEAVKYPKWYPGISAKSKLAEVQHYLQQESVCPEPCEVVEEEEELKNKTKNATEDCYTTLPGDTCYSDILFALDNIAKHPEWYPGLTNYSSKEHFQAFLHGQSSVDKEAEKKKCPAPCDRDAVKEVKIRATCETASEGDECYGSIRWGATVGISKHPYWYPNLTKGSSIEEFQLKLHKDPKTKCPKRPCPCHTHVAGEPCYGSVMWVKKVGLHKHPGHFEGLTKASSFEEIQAHLHATRTTPCLRPCTPHPW